VTALTLSSICVNNSMPVQDVIRWWHLSLHSGVHSVRDTCLMLLIYCANCRVMLPCMFAFLQNKLLLHLCHTERLPVIAWCTWNTD